MKPNTVVMEKKFILKTPMSQQEAMTRLPVNDEVPSGLGRPVAAQRRPAVLQLQRHLRVFGPHQFHLKIQRLLEVLCQRVVLCVVEHAVGII